jgi:ParB/RepB/Spo0J family partition protein
MLSHDQPHVDIGPLRYLLPFEKLLRPLSPDELNGLRENIRARGIEQPVMVHETDDVGVYEVLDGANRVRLGSELGLEKIPIEVRRGLTEDQKRVLAIDLNIYRRQLDREARRRLIAARLKVDPEQSDVVIAGQVGVTDKTVAVVRENMEATSEIPRLTKRKGKDGKNRAQPQQKPQPQPAAGAEGRNQADVVPFKMPLTSEIEAGIKSEIAAAILRSPPQSPYDHALIKEWSGLEYIEDDLSRIAKSLSNLLRRGFSQQNLSELLMYANSLQNDVWMMLCFADHCNSMNDPAGASS